MAEAIRGKRKIKLVWKILAIVLVLLIAFRIALPYIVLRTLNRQLADMGSYTGHIKDIDIHLFRGAYTIDSLIIQKKTQRVQVPFFSSKTIDLSIEWRSVFKGQLVAKIVADHAILNFVNGPTKAQSQSGTEGPDWTEVVKSLVPIRISTLKLVNSEVHYRDYSTTPQVNIFFTQLNGTVSNLTNSDKLSKTLFATIEASAQAMNDGSFKLNGVMDPYEKTPTFDINASLVQLNLPALNNMLSAYTQIDIEQGEFALYVEVAAKGGKYTGYAKPVIKDLKILNWKEDRKKGLVVLWEAVVGGLTGLFKNHPNDQFALQVPFEGTLDGASVNVLAAIGSILKNTFIEALLPSLDNAITLGNVDDVKLSKREKRELGKAVQERQKKKEATKEELKKN